MPVGGNWCEIVTVPPVLFVMVAGRLLIVAVVRPVKVKPSFAVRVTDAVYLVFDANLEAFGDHETVLRVKLPEPDDHVDGTSPATGAITLTAAVVIGVGPNIRRLINPIPRTYTYLTALLLSSSATMFAPSQRWVILRAELCL